MAVVLSVQQTAQSALNMSLAFKPYCHGQKRLGQELERKKELPFEILCLYDGQIVAAFLLLPRTLLFCRFLSKCPGMFNTVKFYN